MTDVTVVVGGQYGSEAKGATVAHISREFTASDCVIRVAGPNAGHTAYSPGGREWKLRSIPVAAVVNDHVQLHIAAGSEIDPIVLADEVTALEDAGIPIVNRLTIHPSATILLAENIAEEGANGIVGRIGSTGKGIGSARAARIMRVAPTAKDLYPGHSKVMMSAPGPFPVDAYDRVVIEGTQGYGLGLHTENYPQVTSSDCRAIDFLAMAGISPWNLGGKFEILVVARCFPIRVAGNSGPLKDETSWEALGLPEERTTVTNKVRRVGAWDPALLRDAIRANGGDGWSSPVRLVITMLDQLFPEIAGVPNDGHLDDKHLDWLRAIEEDFNVEVAYVGTSPTTMFEVGNL
jgi:adenylosuccinate synthase